MSATVIRVATRDDLPALADIYIDAVTTIGPQCYTSTQVAAWRRWPTDEPDSFRERVLAGHTLIAFCADQPAAFAAFTPPDHLDFLYTRSPFSRRGLATQLHSRLEKIARDEGASFLRTEASYLSRPAFTKFGYHVTEVEQVERFGAAFTRFKMVKRLTLGPPATNPSLRTGRPHTPSLPVVARAAAEEVIAFLAHDALTPGWFKGTDPSGTEGFFPRDWFQIDVANRRAIALRDYDSTELELPAGSLVFPLATIGPWHQVITPQWQIGWIPHACLLPPPS